MANENSFFQKQTQMPAERFRTMVNQYATDLINMAQSPFPSKEPKTYLERRKELVGDLRKSYQDEDLVLVIGAGVSLSYGLPDWNTLLQKLLLNSLPDYNISSTLGAKLFVNIFDPNSLIAGRYLQDHFQNSSKKKFGFEEEVRKVLYADFNLDSESELVDEILKFCIAPGRSPNLDSIITYNYDDLIERKLQATGLGISFKSIHSTGMQAESDELPIFHVHGFLPQKGKLNEQNRITLGEAIYHEQYTDTYSWNNLAQLNKFMNKSCLFIGSSLTDPNIRRLLDIAKKQRGKQHPTHYNFRKKWEVDYVAGELRRTLKENADLMDAKAAENIDLKSAANFLVQAIEQFEEKDSKSLGVYTLWVEEFDQIPEVLNSIRKLHGEEAP